MSCGSVLGDLLYLTDMLLETPQTRPQPQIVYQGGNEGLQAKLYRMYGEGQISQDVFRSFRSLAERGALRPADLAVHQASAGQRPISKGDVKAQTALRSLRSRLMQLGNTRAASEKVLSDLEARLIDLSDRVESKEQTARQAVGVSDDDTARRRLAEKVELTSSRSRLAGQAQALREDISRLDHLRTQLEAKAAELEAVIARGELAGLDDS